MGRNRDLVDGLQCKVTKHSIAGSRYQHSKNICFGLDIVEATKQARWLNSRGLSVYSN